MDTILGGSVHELPLVFFDIETTGLSVEKGDEIVEIGAVKTVGGEETASLENLVKPGRPIPPESTRIHGISDLFVMGAPTIGELAADLLKFMEGCVIIAHNAPFDIGFLSAALEKQGMKLPKNLILDTVALSRAVIPELPNHKLDTLKKHFAVPAARSHRALDDSRSLAKVFDKMMKTYFPMLDGGPTLGTVVSRGSGVFRFDDFGSGMPVGHPEHRALLRRSMREGRDVVITMLSPGRFMPEEVRLRPQEVGIVSSGPIIRGVESGGAERTIDVRAVKDIRPS